MKRNTTDDAVLAAKLNDAVRAAQAGRPHFIGFLDERQAAFVHMELQRECKEPYKLWGGYSGAERVMLGVFPEYMLAEEEAFPLVPVTVRFRACDVLSHRDFLGAVLSHGVTRETVGDILVEPGRGVLFVRKEVADFLLLQTEKIGRVGVRISKGAEEPLPALHTFEPFSAVVASARLDCIVAAVVGCSREKAVLSITSGLVMLDHKIVISPSASVVEGAKLSVRGSGRYILDCAGSVTKKGRLRIEGRKYI